MIPFIIKPKGEITPGVSLDYKKGVFEISGWSYPEDAIIFYNPVLEGLSNYMQTPKSETTFHFKFQYYNTATAKQIFKIISCLMDVAKKSKVKICWHYDTNDTDMLASGKFFSKLATVPFEFISG